jgi:hypothetical protein
MLLQPSRWAVYHGENEDFDASEDMRRRLGMWTGYSDGNIPTVLNNSGELTLEVSARLGFCAECWLEDARVGRSPYIRRSWTRWSTVLCNEHRTWLSARRPGVHRGSELNGWAPVWRSKPAWATAAHLHYDPAVFEMARGFESEAVKTPCCGWLEFIATVAMVGDGSPILELTSRPAFAGTRAAVWNAIATSSSRQFSDLYLHGSRGHRPSWISDRICCVVLAGEVVRLIREESPSFETVRRVLELRPEASDLMFRLRKSV